MNEMSALVNGGAPRVSPYPFYLEGLSKRLGIYKPGSGLSLDYLICWHIDLELPDLQIFEK